MTLVDVKLVATVIESRLREQGIPERAEAEKRYLKSGLHHFGVPVWAMRRLVRSFGRDHRELSHDDLVALVEALWSRPIHERRMVAAMMLEAYPELLGPEDLPLLETLVRGSRTWALVDLLAGKVVGALLLRHPGASPKLDRWARDPNLWARRAALLAMIEPLKQGAPFKRFGGYADAMLEEREFFIRKAIGWVLREAGKSRPYEVYEWLSRRTDRASGLTVREAVKYLDPERREALLAAYGEGRTAATWSPIASSTNPASSSMSASRSRSPVSPKKTLPS